jgi:hypothetical protein
MGSSPALYVAGTHSWAFQVKSHASDLVDLFQLGVVQDVVHASHVTPFHTLLRCHLLQGLLVHSLPSTHTISVSYASTMPTLAWTFVTPILCGEDGSNEPMAVSLCFIHMSHDDEANLLCLWNWYFEKGRVTWRPLVS